MDPGLAGLSHEMATQINSSEETLRRLAWLGTARARRFLQYYNIYGNYRTVKGRYGTN